MKTNFLKKFRKRFQVIEKERYYILLDLKTRQAHTVQPSYAQCICEALSIMIGIVTSLDYRERVNKRISEANFKRYQKYISENK